MNTRSVSVGNVQSRDFCTQRRFQFQTPTTSRQSFTYNRARGPVWRQAGARGCVTTLKQQDATGGNNASLLINVARASKQGMGPGI